MPESIHYIARNCVIIS